MRIEFAPIADQPDGLTSPPADVSGRPMSDGIAIRTMRLTKDYGDGHGLFDLDLEVERGEVFGFLGPNGAGKSTTMRLLLDLIAPTSGSARLLGLDSRGDSLAIRRRVGFLPGDFALYPKLTGAAMLDYFAELRGGVDRRVRDALAERFDAELDRPVRELSTGNRQKIGLIQAFMHEPELLILDEPIAGLDPLVQQSFHALLGEVAGAGPDRVPVLAHALGGRARRRPGRDPARGPARGRRLAREPARDRGPAAGDRVRRRAAPARASSARSPGVREATLDGAHVVVAFEGSADALVKAHRRATRCARSAAATTTSRRSSCATTARARTA